MSVLFWFGLKNQPDPLWAKTGEVLRQHPRQLYEHPDSLQQLFCSIHHTPFVPGDSSAWNWVAQPSLSNIEWDPFVNLVKKTQQQQFIVLGGVTGAGATKYSKHLGRLLSGSPDRLLEIDCAPLFDLEYHKKYIGRETEDGIFLPGKLLAFWDSCQQQPGQSFATVIDNFDKINPETFFGPELWEALSTAKVKAVINGYKVKVPKNFYLISVTHLGPGSLVELNEEHYKRLGRPYALEPNPNELWNWLQEQKVKIIARGATAPADSSRLTALQDTAQMHRFLYYFTKSNEMILERYGPGYQLGQGSDVRAMFRASDVNALKQVFINHINALLPGKPLFISDFDKMDFTVNHQGLEPGTNLIARQIQFLQDTGYLVEISVVIATALLTALAGWWVFRRREQLMRLYGDRALMVYSSFEKQEISAEEASFQLESIKTDVDELVMNRKLNYTEALYFLAFIEDKAKRIQFARNVTENFLELFNTFMEDDVLTENEYNKLIQFLESIRHKIPEEVFQQFYQKVQNAYTKAPEL
ncbi:MAG: hypothetical protein IPL65_12740 [Lewinellaceae bacterium]|nr:hypothetical protein [Lewinellaceae bacterium]